MYWRMPTSVSTSITFCVALKHCAEALRATQKIGIVGSCETWQTAADSAEAEGGALLVDLSREARLVARLHEGDEAK